MNRCQENTAQIVKTFRLCHSDSKVHGANMGPIWGRQDPDGPHVGPMDFAIWAITHHSNTFALDRCLIVIDPRAAVSGWPFSSLQAPMCQLCIWYMSARFFCEVFPCLRSECKMVKKKFSHGNLIPYLCHRCQNLASDRQLSVLPVTHTVMPGRHLRACLMILCFAMRTKTIDPVCNQKKLQTRLMEPLRRTLIMKVLSHNRILITIVLNHMRIQRTWVLKRWIGVVGLVVWHFYVCLYWSE